MHPSYTWILGVLLAALASFISNLGVNLQKLDHLRHEANPKGEADQYHKRVLWQIGLAFVVFGSLADFAALSFSPQSLIAPLGSLTLVSNSLLAPLLLKEVVTGGDLFATSTIVIGSIIAVMFANHDDITYPVDDLFRRFLHPAFVLYSLIVTGTIVGMSVALGRIADLEKRKPRSADFIRLQPYQRFMYPSASGIIGAQSVLLAKCACELVVNFTEGHGAIFRWWQTYAVFWGLGCTIFFQIKWINEGLARYDSLYTIPVFTAHWICLSVVSGLVFYSEYDGMNGFQMLCFLAGIAIDVTGVLLLSRRAVRVRATQGAEPEVVVVKNGAPQMMQNRAAAAAGQHTKQLESSAEASEDDDDDYHDILETDALLSR